APPSGTRSPGDGPWSRLGGRRRSRGIPRSNWPHSLLVVERLCRTLRHEPGDHAIGRLATAGSSVTGGDHSPCAGSHTSAAGTRQAWRPAPTSSGGPPAPGSTTSAVVLGGTSAVTSISSPRRRQPASAGP